ncbi:pirin family protein [Marinomonas epiphytica]
MSHAILRRKPLGLFWPTQDPFLFCAFHNDHYPKGNVELGPAAPLNGRSIGNDFEPVDGWRMYHGETIPGFPAHPHRGFETVTVVNKGFVDHADSMGASGRYGEGDTQWMTAGKGVQHSEMFPLLNQDRSNPIELFQIWLNLPGKNKMVPPHFTMLWNEETPIITQADENGIECRVKLIAGALRGIQAPPCAPNSWAANAENEVAIWIIDIPEKACWNLPAASKGLSRSLYFFEGTTGKLDDADISVNEALDLHSELACSIQNTGKAARFLLLQGKPIAEPVAQQGPFVMNTKQELQQTFADFQRTQFGGWPWPRRDQVHAPQQGRFATGET